MVPSSKHKKVKKKAGKYKTAVKMSIHIPFSDQKRFLAFPYKINNAKHPRPHKDPTSMLKGYATGCWDISWNAAMEYQRITLTIPKALTADNPNATAEVFMLQFFAAVLENSKQNKAEIPRERPKSIRQNGQL